jgi:hypothetical protein
LDGFVTFTADVCHQNVGGLTSLAKSIWIGSDHWRAHEPMPALVGFHTRMIARRGRANVPPFFWLALNLAGQMQGKPYGPLVKITNGPTKKTKGTFVTTSPSSIPAFYDLKEIK